MELNKKEMYLSPEAKIFEVKQEGVICVSGRLNSPDNYNDAGTTLQVLPDDAARGSLTSYTVLRTTAVSNWAVAQMSDYEEIFTNLGSSTGNSNGKTYDGNVNAYITTGVGGTALDDACSYWSATEKDGDNVWAFNRVFWGSSEKTNNFSVRPVLGF